MFRVNCGCGKALALSCAMLAATMSYAAGPSIPDFSGYWLQKNAKPQLLTTEGKTPPLNADAAKRYAATSAAKTRQQTDFDPVARCVPPGMPRMMGLPYPFEVLQRPDELTLLFGWNRISRDMQIGGKAYEPEYPLAIGVSTAHWEDQALVIDTAGLRGDTWLDDYGMPHSDRMTLREKLELRDHGDTLIDEMTITDPLTFLKPWSIRFSYRKLPDTFSFFEDVCLDRLDAGQPAIDYSVHWR